MTMDPRTVYGLIRLGVNYRDRDSIAAPELPNGRTTSPAQSMLRALFVGAGLDRPHIHQSTWNPLGDYITPSDRVLIKPNWVYHTNKSGHTLDSVVTHTSVIAAVVDYVAKARPSRIIIADAPIQGCCFRDLCERLEIASLLDRPSTAGLDVAIKDLRRVIRDDERLHSLSRTSARHDADYILFDLKNQSQLEPISNEGRFRVTMYDPDELQRSHGPGRHAYLISREAMEADVIINLPKLKTHQKAGVTGALKNIVGINGLKNYLPHHRLGGSDLGGDCYEGHSYIKSVIERSLDATNRSHSPFVRRSLALGVRLGQWIGRFAQLDGNLEGAWHGNDTVWRMCIDLQRILHFGRLDGHLAATRQRRILTITDAIVAGEGNGPLAPSPVPLGLLTMSESTAAADWVHALMMGIDPHKLP
jgi:uncharacterized protein (DUF362 family)